MTSSQAAAIFKRTNFVGRTDTYLHPTANELNTHALHEALRGVKPLDISGSLLTDPYVNEAVSRLGEYANYVNFYAGRHHTLTHLNGFKLPTYRYPRRIVNKRATWIAGRKNSFQFVPRKGNEAVCEVLDAVWRANRKKSLIRRTAKMSLTYGDAFWYITVKTKGPDDKPLPPEQQSIRICPINPSYVYPVWSEADPNNMRGCMIQFPYTAPDGKQRLFTTIYTRDFVETYSDLTLEQRVPNTLGLIPIVHIPNGQFGDMPFGISALADVIPAVERFNELLAQVGRIIQNAADPTTVIFGASLGTMERNANRVWSNLPSDGRIDLLELKSDLSAVYKYVEEQRDEILMAGCTPQIAFEARQLATSNSSGLAIQLLFQPLLEVTEEAQDTFTEAIFDANRVIAAIYDKHFQLPLTGLADSPKDFLTTDLFWPSMLPRDWTQEVDGTLKMVEAQLISRAEASRRLAGVTDTERAAIEIAADKAAQIAMDLEKSKAMNGQPINFAGIAQGSMFVNEDLLDIVEQLGSLQFGEGKKAGDDTDSDDE